MGSRLVRFSLVTLASLVIAAGPAASPGRAQTPGVSGTVKSVDVVTRTIHFTDGRTLTLAPGAHLTVGGREIALAEIRPGWNVVTDPTAAAPNVVVTQQTVTQRTTPLPAAPASPAPLPAMPAPSSSHPPVDATGVVSTVDPQTGTITLQDGRVLHVTPGTTLWLPVTIAAVRPGEAVYVRSAQPIGFSPSTGTSAPRQYLMGTVRSIDQANSRVVLSDGSVVHLAPGARAEFNGQAVTIRGLRPGDEVVVAVPGAGTTVMTAPGAALSALPRAALSDFETDELRVVRRPQAP